MLEVQDIIFFSVTPIEAILNLLVALVCSVCVAILYRYVYQGISYSSGYVISLIMLTLITSMVIMVIGNNLARAFGLVGAMSIIRFRTAIKDTQDIMFIFFCLAIGLACGASMYAISITGTLFIGLVVLIASKLNEHAPMKKEYLVQIIFEKAEMPETIIHDVLSQFCSKYKLVNLKKIGTSDLGLTEYSYYVVLKRQSQAELFTTTLNQLDNVKKVNVFFDEV